MLRRSRGWKCEKNEIWREVEDYTLEDPDFGEGAREFTGHVFNGVCLAYVVGEVIG